MSRKITMLVIAILFALLVPDVHGQCNVCLKSNVACINVTHFAPCFNGMPDLEQINSCPLEDGVCTDLTEACVSRDYGTPACDLPPETNPKCGNCLGVTDGEFVCLSPTRYAMCIGDQIAEAMIFECKVPGEVCYSNWASIGEPCVEECDDLSHEMCFETVVEDNTTADPTGSTANDNTTDDSTPSGSGSTDSSPDTTVPKETTPSGSGSTDSSPDTTLPRETSPSVPVTSETTPNTTIEEDTPDTTTAAPTLDEIAAETCATKTSPGRFPYGTDCNKYVNCYKKGTVMQSAMLSCNTNWYFDPKTTFCTQTKPQGCA